MELFENQSLLNQPLAARMRPRTLEEYIGQETILGEGRLLRRLIQADRLSSLIFYGPPGTGKTTLASVIANTTQSRFVILNAVLSGVKELRLELESAAEALKLYDKKTILFVDEVHRWNRSQQDALLPWVENGTVILIGATTENPYFEVNQALVSRSRIFRLQKLNPSEMREVLFRAVKDPVRGYGDLTISLEESAINHLIHSADGDARNLLNALELAVETTVAADGKLKGKGEIFISLSIAEESIQEKAVLYDKEGEYHYDVISAFIKSIRGSDPDATLYWLARMIAAGENPRFIFRRMLISACEDVGLADPRALQVVESAAAAFDRVGLPEGRFMLAHAALYLSTCEKSNSSLAFFDALELIQKESFQEVPNSLKDASRDSEAFAHGKGYLYPHAFKDHWVAQQYLPTALQGKIFYHPSKEGYEATIRDRVLRHRELQLALSLSEEEEEQYSFSFENQKQSEWLKRAMQGVFSSKKTVEALIQKGEISRHFRILVLEERSAILYWELLRKAGEGGVYLLSDNESICRHIEHHFQENEIDDIPLLINGNRKNLQDLSVLMQKNRGLQFDRIMARHLLNGFYTEMEVNSLVVKLVPFLAVEGELLFTQKDFFQSTLLSTLLSLHMDSLPSSSNKEEAHSILCELTEIEKKLKEVSPFCWTEEKVLSLIQKTPFVLKERSLLESEKNIKVDSALIEQWFLSDRIGYGNIVDPQRREFLIQPLKTFLLNQTVTVKTTEILYHLVLSK